MLGKKDVASLGSWTYFVERLEKDIRQIKKDDFSYIASKHLPKRTG